MIYDNIDNRSTYCEMGDIFKALEWLAKQTDMPTEQVSIDGDTIFANAVEFTSKPLADCKFEAHNKYIDLHYIFDGVEGIACSPRNTLQLIENHLSDRDIAFFDGQAHSISWLRKGFFMVCFPHDGHMPALMENEPAAVKKIIVKIKV